jgi:hypothetical protein
MKIFAHYAKMESDISYYCRIIISIGGISFEISNYSIRILDKKTL